MALIEYFPNYIWNLSVAIAMESGGQIGEIVDMCQPIREAAASGSDAGTPQWKVRWTTGRQGLADWRKVAVLLKQRGWRVTSPTSRKR